VSGNSSYKWEPNDRLKKVIDAVRGMTEYGHDTLGNLAWAKHGDGSVDLRMPDAVGNLFKTEHRNDRQYGPAGQLLAAQTSAGWVQYKYDREGNLIEKLEPSGRRWRYEWKGCSRLSKVVRPDGSEVSFQYDALGRRISKNYRGQTTKWVWDGNNPLHEWVEGARQPLPASDLASVWSADAEVKHREAELQRHLSQGPPFRGTREAPITWLFEPESFAPMAKLVGDEQYSIVTDHIGTPVLMTDASGSAVWSSSISPYGELRELAGERQACPFRWPGQYEDAETGLYYNGLRYYDALSGRYISQDPIRLAAGPEFYSYVADPLVLVDPLGLACHRQTPRVDTGNLKEGWMHIDARHITGNHPSGAGDLFAAGTTRAQVEEAAKKLVEKGTRITDPSKQIQIFEKRMKVNGKRDRVRTVVDSHDGNRVISIFPVRSE